MKTRSSSTARLRRAALEALGSHQERFWQRNANYKPGADTHQRWRRASPDATMNEVQLAGVVMLIVSAVSTVPARRN